jgi:methylated-DNA-protein-cysteine methyltransferase-like protein
MAARKRAPVTTSTTSTFTTATGEPRVVGPGFHARVHEVVRTVPAGHVTTYGDVAGALGSRSVARQVGFALAGLAESRTGHDVPWHRVLNGQGTISFRGDVVRGSEQRDRLESEGVCFDASGRVVDFERVRFVFPTPHAQEPEKA